MPPSAGRSDGTEVLDTPEQLRGLWPEWERLDAGASWSLNDSAWARAWMETAAVYTRETAAVYTRETAAMDARDTPAERNGSAPDGDSGAVVVRDAGIVSAVAPLVRSTRRGARYTLPGCEAGEPLDFSYADEDALSELIHGIVRLGIPIEIPRLPAEGPTLHALRRAYRPAGAVVVRPAPSSPAIELDETWEEPERKLSARRRSDLRRAMRRAQSWGEVSVTVESPGTHDFDATFELALRVEAAGWKGRSGTALLTAGRQGEAFRRFFTSIAAAGRLRAVWLWIGGEPAAVQLAAERGGHFCLLKVGYDEQFGHCSPGQLLQLESIRAAAARGLASYEFLGNPEPWTRVWTRYERPCVAVRAFPATPGGMLSLFSDAATHLGSRVRAFRYRS